MATFPKQVSLTTFKTQSLAQGTVSKYGGKNKWKDGGYLGECVSEINQYCWRVLSVPADAWGHAVWWGDKRNVAVQKYFKLVSTLAPGDILVYPASFGGGYGHIEIYLGSGKSLGQNRYFDGRVLVENVLPGYYAILRDITPAKKPAALPKAVTTRSANVRLAPRLSATVTRTLPKGYVFSYKRIVRGDSIAWNLKWYQTSKDHYIWSGNVRKV